MWTNELGPWLAHSAVSGTLILLLGAMAVRYCREPVYRIRIIQWVFFACLMVPFVQQFGLQPAYSVSLGRIVPADTMTSESTVVRQSHDQARDRDAVTQLDPAELVNMTESSEVLAEQAGESPLGWEPAVDESALSVDSSVGDELRSSTMIVVSRTIQTAYFSLVAVFSVWWCVGFIRRRAITRNAYPATEDIRGVLSSIAGRKADRVQLLVSPSVSSPVMWGCWQPTIVIPASHANTPSDAQLRWGLAHEWSHVVRRDFRAHLLAGLAKLVCFYQPIYWWLRRELSLSQDFLADAFAAQHGDATEEYAAFLVSMARQRQASLSAVSLGMSDGRSNLFKRIRVLLLSPRPLQSGRRIPATMIAFVAVATMIGFGSVRIRTTVAETEPVKETEQAPAGPDNQDSDKQAAKVEQSEAGAITYAGRVVDSESGEPIAEATVEVKREFSRDPETGKWRLLEMTSHKSDASGHYEFTLPPEQVAESSLYLEVNAHHPDYQSKGWSGYSHSMIRTNIENGDPPFYATVKLSPGKPITGIVKGPDGTAVRGVQVNSYSVGPTKDGERRFGRGSFQYTETDDEGRFRIIVATPGDGVFWIHPSEFASQAHRIGDERGDKGTFVLREGVRLSGQVLDAKGNPVPNAAVNVRRRGDGEKADEFLNSHSVASGISGGTRTDENGRFQLKPLPPGDYQTRIEGAVSDPTVRSENWFDKTEVELVDVFAPLQITISANTKPEPIVIQALPHVVIRGRFFNSAGEPRASHSQHLFGQFNGTFLFTESTRPGDDGWFELRAPHGTTDARVSTNTNEHSALRWRLEGMDEFTYGQDIPLGTLEADVNGLEIIRYSAPILLVKAVDESQTPVKGYRVSSSYVKRPLELEGVEGDRRLYREGDVGFEEQADGRWRSSQLLPDEEISIQVVMDGFESEPQTVSLREKETRELSFVLKKTPGESEPE